MCLFILFYSNCTVTFSSIVLISCLDIWSNKLQSVPCISKHPAVEIITTIFALQRWGQLCITYDSCKGKYACWQVLQNETVVGKPPLTDRSNQSRPTDVLETAGKWHLDWADFKVSGWMLSHVLRRRWKRYLTWHLYRMKIHTFLYYLYVCYNSFLLIYFRNTTWSTCSNLNT